jgi:peptidoglycan/LPS O-acetylase OafA/YrhL
MRKIDNNIVLLRFIAIILIVYHHSIISLCGWPPIDISLPTLPMSVLLSSGLAKNIGLVLFTFISGYLITYTGKSYSLGYIWNKVRKILFPCVIIATLYYFLFPSMMFDSDPVNGTHLWYLPMIFLFYMFSPAVKTKSLSKSVLLIFLAFGSFVLMSKLTSLRTFAECIRYWPAFVGGVFFSIVFKQLYTERGNICCIRFNTYG